MNRQQHLDRYVLFVASLGWLWTMLGCDRQPLGIDRSDKLSQAALVSSQLARPTSRETTASQPDAETQVHSHTFATTIRQPPSLGGVQYTSEDHRSTTSTVQCSLCHSLRPANSTLVQAAELDEFHQGLTFAHGTLSCASCHNASNNYASLKLADGTSVEFSESMKLCAQCHGTQYRDYQHGAHGGMSGYWDLSRGPRERNHCQHCHDPHAPAYPTFTPVEGPRDRFRPVSSHTYSDATASAAAHQQGTAHHE